MRHEYEIGRKPVILVFIRYFIPGFRSGGPVRSICNLVNALYEDYDIRVVCLSRDLGESIDYAGIEIDCWTQTGNFHVYYASEGNIGFAFCRRIIRQVKPDMIYLNSLLDVSFSMQPFLVAGRGHTIPILLAPRGELSCGALGLKPRRKRVFLAIARATDWYAYVNWHASSSEEEERISQVFSPQSDKLFQVRNIPGITINHNQQRSEKVPGELRVVQLARVSQMKNTLGAIRIMRQLSGKASLDLWGPLEDKDYWEKCKREISICPPNVEVRYRGELPHEEIQHVLKSYDVMLLPTLGENFGHSIIEALSAGLPVVTSNRTPWKGLIGLGIGADLPLENEQEFIRELERFQAMNSIAIGEASEMCKVYATQWKDRHFDKGAYMRMFSAVLNSEDKPWR